MAAIVRVQNLYKNYYLGSVTVNVLKGIDLEIEEGDFVALMGPSGSGKSTLMNILGCLDRPTSGDYILSGRNVAHLNDDRLSDVRSRYLGFIFQSYNLLPQYTVVENIELPLMYQGIPLNAMTRHRCVALAGMVGLGDRLDHRPLQLSGGQQQRVAIARALATEPAVIFADEPTGNLDSDSAEEVMALIDRLNQDNGQTYVLVTHAREVAAHAGRVVRMRDGEIVADTLTEAT